MTFRSTGFYFHFVLKKPYYPVWNKSSLLQVFLSPKSNGHACGRRADDILHRRLAVSQPTPSRHRPLKYKTSGSARGLVSGVFSGNTARCWRAM